MKGLFLTATHLGIVMEHATGGDLFDLVSEQHLKRLEEAKARWCFQQLVVAVDFRHRQGLAVRWGR